MDGILSFTQGVQNPPADAVRFRTLLFAHLHRRVRLTSDEKHIAKQTAINDLITLLRSIPNPPVHVKTDGQVRKQEGRLTEQIETAYTLRMRPSQAGGQPAPSFDLMQSLATFIGGTLPLPSQ